MLKRCLAALALVLAINAFAGTQARAGMDDPLADRLSPALVKQMFPDSDGTVSVDGDPPVATVTRAGETLGYLFSTHETVRPAGYSGLSFDIIVALDPEGMILGHHVLEEHEPLISENQISIADISGFLALLHQFNIQTTRRPHLKKVDAISGATVSAMAMRRATMGAAVMVGYLKGIIADGGEGLTLDRYSFAERTWPKLVADGSIRELTVSYGDVRKAFDGDTPDGLELGPDQEPLATFYAALATPPSIGRNVFGARAFRQISQSATRGEQQVIIGSIGGYLWLPRNPWLVEVFDRVHIIQNGKSISLRPENFYPALRFAIEGAPRFRQAGRFRIPNESGFDPFQEWSVEIRVAPGADGEGVDEGPSVAFHVPYRVPARYVMGDDVVLEDAGFKEPTYVGLGSWRQSTLSDWQRTWVDNQWSIVALLALLTAATAVMLSQNILTRSRSLHAWVRVTLLVATLVWLGWIVGAQLNILTIINYATLAINGTAWRTVLYDPLLVILTGYVLVSLVLWGRGLFCGWLCPFGALQELLAKLGAVLRVPRITVPPRVQARAWVIKYGIAAVILGLALFSTGWATIAAEVEPFKTAISLRFDRSWPYVLYAVLLLGAGLFIERFFCRYLCPLGAVLALAGRFHLFNWLKRRPECGTACHLCERSCPIAAIAPSGQINMNECLQCLDCQVEYYDEKRCPPLVAERKRRFIGDVVPAE
jgi:NosR/NirI family nitrous oxide reductase transcriptional regulator